MRFVIRGVGGCACPARSTTKPEHWTRIKALSRRFAELGSTEYSTLRPVADFIARLIEHLTVMLSGCQFSWEPDNATEEMKRQVIADIASAVTESCMSWVKAVCR